MNALTAVVFGACCGNSAPVTEAPEDVEVKDTQLAKCVIPEKTPGPDVTDVAEAAPQEPRPPPLPEEFHLELHSATLKRSFAKVGWMDPYAIILVDDKVIERTQTARHEHKHPHWNCGHAFRTKELPTEITIAVWDKNTFHKDVFCGSVTIPCAPDMGFMERKDLNISKRGTCTGTVNVTLKGHGYEAVAPVIDTPKSVAGGEMDGVVSWHRTESGHSILLQETENLKHWHDREETDELHHVGHKIQAESPAAADEQFLATPLLDSWHCVNTWGLDEFLKATGVGMFQRKLASAARWPAWEFALKGERVLFTNHSAIGDLIEEFTLGQEYTWKDGHKNDLTCKAEFTPCSDGGVLVTSRKGTLGNYQEERRVQGNTLEFTLTHATGVKWGRKFERD